MICKQDITLYILDILDQFPKEEFSIQEINDIIGYDCSKPIKQLIKTTFIKYRIVMEDKKQKVLIRHHENNEVQNTLIQYGREI